MCPPMAPFPWRTTTASVWPPASTGFSVHQDLVELARQLPQGKPLFFVYTYGLKPGTGAKALYQIAKEKGCPVLGEFSCRGFNTFGPFKLAGGTAKGHPDEQDLEQARAFFRGLLERLEG